ncbi:MULTISPECIES: acyl-CoA thioesterase [unclassified Coleofasciculus]|uniref:acyl-CoA thioesterase n=1 Tax=unclassified Coleofasciculus TaxID=2692782 RepID=UPI00187F222A|nr:MULTISPECIES: thioesterase family protein [unclassified Coleofasciculus]MBE9126470.1 acyl-CoA thioesterase [Coleofasciculus sp. LEGE 07081]MBE9148908.1 acyl-CoA thioesterase [Coleofasciculus sp. LEGE 07092]
MQTYTTQLRVRHYEMDALGHVNNAVYQNYLEQAAIEHSEQLGFSLEQCRKLGGVFVMRRIAIDYLRPAVAGDTLAITTWLQQMKGTRAIRFYEIRCLGEEDLLVTAEVLWVWVDSQTMRPKGIPKEILENFKQIQSS